MSYVSLSVHSGIATLTFKRGKVNALHEPLIEELHAHLRDLEKEKNVKAVILTGAGKFFSFGFDIPEFLSYAKENFLSFLEKFLRVYLDLFLFPKPVVAALNGHTIAGGCMLATACDLRIMVSGKAKISLNEISFGASVFAGTVAMLRHCVGTRNAETILLSGAMYSAEEAKALGLVDKVSPEDQLTEEARQIAEEFAQKDESAFRSIKHLLRQPVAEDIARRETKSHLDFVEIWYSEKTRRNLREIKIHS